MKTYWEAPSDQIIGKACYFVAAQTPLYTRVAVINITLLKLPFAIANLHWLAEN